MYKSILLTLLMPLMLFSASPARAREAWRGFCEEGGKHIITSGLSSTTLAQVSHPSCIITVYNHGSGLATIYSDNNGTPLANPFTAQTGGMWEFFANDGVYDVTMTSAGFSQPVTFDSILLCDPFVAGAVCAAGGAASAHNLLSVTHLDTIPASPPVRGDLITSQNQTSPTGVNPSWARLPLGSSGQVLLSNGVDALWGTLTAGTGITITNNTGSLTIATAGGGSGCTLTGINLGVISEHPLGTCFDSVKFTWDATNEIMLSGDGANTAPSATFAFLSGGSNSSTGTGLCCGDYYFVRGNGNTTSLGGFLFVDGASNTLTSASDIYMYGENNQADHAGNSVILGFSNTLIPATPNTQQNLNAYVVGRANALKSITGSNGIKDTVVLGSTNQITNTNTTGGSSREMQGVFVAGEGNILLQNTGNLMQTVHIVGANNTIGNTLNDTLEVDILGLSNQVDGSLSTVQILGYLNIAHNASPQRNSTVNTTIVGAANTITNTGASGTPAYQGVFGASSTLQNCSACWIVGQGVTNSTSNTLWIGMSAVPGIKITNSGGSNDNVQRAPLVFASLPACAAGTEGSFAAITDSNTNTWGATITGSSTNHVLGYCDGTNWTVAGK